MADSMARKTEDLKRQCKNSFSAAEESYQGAMSSSKRHATMHRKSEALEKLCNARVYMEVKVGGWCRFPMWDSVQVAAVVTRVMRIRREGVSALVLVVLRLDMLG
ncbi:unnamed protein product [Prunus armeniaca]